MKNPFKTILLLVCVAIVSCEGPEGPQGPKGDTGAQGPSGTGTGVQGPKGEPGNANVIAGSWVNRNHPSFWKRDGSFDWWATLEAPQLTGSMVENSVVLVYGKNPATKAVYVLPLPVGKWVFRVTFFEKQVNIYQHWINGDAPGSFAGLGGVDEFRYVLIPITASSRLKNLDYSNYKNVCQTLGIEE